MAPASTDNFYAALPALHHFTGVIDSKNFVPVPEDWYILITDIKDSTQAIAAGRYKEVNLLGASSIVAALNVAGQFELPFVFGGDGATLLIPPALMAPMTQALLAIREMAQQRFNLDLRVGLVPVATVVAAAHAINIAKYRVSDNYSQANFMGGGLTYATQLVKDASTSSLYQVRPDGPLPLADLSGLECRWQDIPSEPGQTLSLIVLATGSSGHQTDATYRDVLAKLAEIYGTDEKFHPVLSTRLKLSFNPIKLQAEVKAKSGSVAIWHYISRLISITLENLLGLWFMAAKMRLGGTDWGRYKTDVIGATDYRKFDDMLRMVIASSATQTEQLTQYFEQQVQAGRLTYGLHISDRALMTCLVFERNGRQVHFIDGADGGYTHAATALKQQMHKKTVNWQTYLRTTRQRHQNMQFETP